MTLFFELAFWFGVGGLAYIYAGYPLLVWWNAQRRPKAVLKDAVERSISIVIVVHNEAKSIGRKLDCVLACAKSEWIREILIGSDGSTDATVAVVRSHPDPRVRVVEFDERRGKPAVLNDVVPACSGEVVILADARQEFDVHCLERLVENFADPTVGVVSSELVLRAHSGESAAARGIGFYWKYEKFIRKSESRWRGVPGATGACYALRRSLFRSIPNATILDDVAIPMSAVEQGYRCLFEPQALIYDNPSDSTGKESIRKRRTIAGAAQLVRLFPQWLNPLRNPLWMEYVSHKLLRLVSPPLLLMVLVANGALLADPIYQWLAVLQLAFYLSATMGWICQAFGQRMALCGPPLMFLALNVTTAMALWDAARSRYRVTWQK